MDLAMQRGMKFHRGAAGASGDMVLVKNLHDARAAAELSGDYSGAFGDQGLFQQSVPNLKELQNEEDDDDEEAAESPTKKQKTNDSQGSQGDNQQDAAAADGGKKDDKWFDRDTQIADAVKKHKTWMKEMEAKMKEVKKELKELFSKAKPEDYAEIKNDVELARGRYNAVRLVMTKTAAPAPLQGGHEGGDRISLLELITEETIELSDGTHIRNDREAGGGASDQQRLQESLAKLRSRPKAAASPPKNEALNVAAVPTHFEGGDDEPQFEGVDAQVAAAVVEDQVAAGAAGATKATVATAGESADGDGFAPPKEVVRSGSASDGGCSFLDNLLMENKGNPTLAVKKIQSDAG